MPTRSASSPWVNPRAARSLRSLGSKPDVEHGRSLLRASHAGTTLGSSSVTIEATVGDRLALFITSEAVEARADLSVIFNEAISIPSGNLDDELRNSSCSNRVSAATSVLSPA